MSEHVKNVAIAMFIILAVTSMVMFAQKDDVTIDYENSIVLDGGTYDTEVYVIVTRDTQKAFDFVVEHTNHPVEPTDFESSGVTYTDNEGRIVVWLYSVHDRGVVNHELFHATASIMSWANVPFDESTEESYAYQLQYLTNQFYNKIKQ